MNYYSQSKILSKFSKCSECIMRKKKKGRIPNLSCSSCSINNDGFSIDSMSFKKKKNNKCAGKGLRKRKKQMKASRHRACISCHVSKVKCVFTDGKKSCQRCLLLNIPCVPNPYPKKKKKKRKRLSDKSNMHGDTSSCYRTEGCKRPYRHSGHCRLGESRSVLRARRRELKLKKAETTTSTTKNQDQVSKMFKKCNIFEKCIEVENRCLQNLYY